MCSSGSSLLQRPSPGCLGGSSGVRAKFQKLSFSGLKTLQRGMSRCSLGCGLRVPAHHLLPDSPGLLRTLHRLKCTPRLHPGRGVRREGPLLSSNLPERSGPDEKTPGKATSGPTITVPSLTGRYGTHPYQGLAPTCSQRELFPPGVHSSRSHTLPDCARRTDLTPWRGVGPHTYDNCHHSRTDSACRCPARQAKRRSQPSLRGNLGDIRLAPPANEPPSVGMRKYAPLGSKYSEQLFGHPGRNTDHSSTDNPIKKKLQEEDQQVIATSPN
ncbi:hypothetical protein E1301_Tti011782 [Triplophysa tibetana]|uniref:Uncharacterized protein n=1 Tax=Triplophysa tibetana TaxID=1572043 RepID=A0A5A9NKY0_9TELE|nr:hypothetical protein E1301_Tti011782 [Triplophysa tibetana]